jgi:hypothetical protein
MAWRIDRDYLDGGTGETAVGTRSVGPELAANTFRFRLLDDDGVIYYGGAADAAAAEHDDAEGGLYEALCWGRNHAGATDLEVHVRDGVALGLTSRDYVDQQGKTDDGDWIGIYG